ncbi:MAG TPA: transcriptional repressor, partial [Intrasporangium sp.]|nr:transcriptional repressor [Intrasporangium sp.]
MTTTPRKPTRQQAAVADLLDKYGDFTSAQTVHARLREAGEGVGLATVYRTLQAMVEAGTVD